LAQVIVEREWDLLELRTIGMSLEDIFLQLTTDECVSDTISEGVPAAGKEEVGDA
jgi:hypothetical protein